MALTEELLGLAASAAQTVVAAAATDGWQRAKQAIARILGRGDGERARLAEGRLEAVQEQLAAAPAPEAPQVQARLEAAWQTRIIDLLEEHPDAAGELRALVDQIQAELPARVVSAAGHGVAAGGDVTISASGGGVAAGTIQGPVSTANPTGPDRAGS
jgi:hypothetical protein